MSDLPSEEEKLRVMRSRRAVLQHRRDLEGLKSLDTRLEEQERVVERLKDTQQPTA